MPSREESKGKAEKIPPTAHRFKPGQSGNPAGRKPRTAEDFDLIKQCKIKTPDALSTIEHIMLNGETEKNRLSAAQMIIERAYGKPKQEVEAQVTGQIEQIVRRVVDPKGNA